MENIYNLTKEDLESYLININDKKFRSTQIYDWLYVKRVKSFLPEHGNVGIMCITDKQFGNIELFYGKKLQGVTTPGQQLELF